jgi:hypothetical protein
LRPKPQQTITSFGDEIMVLLDFDLSKGFVTILVTRDKRDKTMASTARQLKRASERSQLQQIHDRSDPSRAALRLLLGRAIAQRQFYDPIFASRRPLLELVQTSLPSEDDNPLKTESILHHKVENDVADTVFSRSMADAIDRHPTWPANSRVNNADRARTCGVWQGFKTCSNNHHVGVTAFCNNHKRCRRCARADARKQAEKLYLVAKHLLKRPRAGYSLRMLTVTIRNSGNVIADIAKLKLYFPKLYRSMFKTDFSAARSRYELGPDNKTVHAHVLIYCRFIDVKAISAKWQELTGDSKIVDIRKVETNTDKKLRQACNEVCKYVTDLDKWIKQHGIDDACDQIADLTLRLKGERFGETYGNFRSQVFKKTFNYAMPKPEEHDPLLCNICGSTWAKYEEVIEPRGPPRLTVVHA